MKTSRPNVALTMATLAFAVSFAVWSILSPLAIVLQKQYRIDDFRISVLIAIPVILGAIARLPMGILTDRFGGRKVMTALLLFTIIPTVGITTAHTFTTFAFWAFLLGMAGSSFAIGVPFVSRSFGPDKQGLVVGIFGIGNIGTAISARVVPVLTQQYGWRMSFYLYAVVVLVTAIAVYLLSGDEQIPAGPTPSLRDRLAFLRNHRLSWLFSLFYFLTFGGFVAFGIYLPKLLVDLYGINKIDAGNRTAIFVVLATLARPLGGWVSDKIGAQKVLMVTFGIVTLFALVLSGVTQVVVLTLSFLLIAVFLGLGNGAVFKLVTQHFAKDAGLVTGLVGAAGGLGGFFPPIVMGFAKTSFHSYMVGYALLAVVSLICFILSMTILGKSRPASVEQSRIAMQHS